MVEAPPCSDNIHCIGIEISKSNSITAWLANKYNLVCMKFNLCSALDCKLIFTKSTYKRYKSPLRISSKRLTVRICSSPSYFTLNQLFVPGTTLKISPVNHSSSSATSHL